MGYVGSEAGTQLSNFMGDNSGHPSVVLLDEFDHCDSETWEAFYHIFDEGSCPSCCVVLYCVVLYCVVLYCVVWCGDHFTTPFALLDLLSQTNPPFIFFSKVFSRSKKWQTGGRRAQHGK